MSTEAVENVRSMFDYDTFGMNFTNGGDYGFPWWLKDLCYGFIIVSLNGNLCCNTIFNSLI